jgi:hypothetical protein
MRVAFDLDPYFDEVIKEFAQSRNITISKYCKLHLEQSLSELLRSRS